jgi:hypothetical protein
MTSKKKKTETQQEVQQQSQIQTQRETQPSTLPSGLVKVEELSEEEFRRLTEREVDVYTKTAIDIINAVAESDKPLRFTISDSLNLETLIRKLDYRVRKFNKRSAEYKIVYRVYVLDRQIVAWKVPK